MALLLAHPTVSEAGLFGHKRHKKPKESVAAPAQIVGIVLEPLPDGLRLQIDCSTRVKFRWGKVENSNDFYVDLEGAQIANVMRHLLVGANGISDIRTETLGPAQVRILLGLRDGVKPHVDRSDDGRSITLRIQTPEPIPVTPTPPPLPLPLPLPPPSEQAQQLPRAPDPLAPSTPSMPPAAPAGPRVTGIDVENLSAAEAVVRVHVEGRLASWKSFRLREPPRLVLELAGAEHVVERPRFTGSGPLSLGSVWSAQFQRDPLVTRVVIQLPRADTVVKAEPPDATGEMRVRVGSPASATARPMPSLGSPRFPRGLRIGIDPGHGGSDPGALNPRLKIYEKNITLDISRRLARLLEAEGVHVSMTRHDDRRLEPSERIRFVSTGDADLFVSIHCDAIEGRPEWTGITTYHHGGSIGSRQLAAALQSCLPEATGLPDRGIRSDMTRFASGFYVLRNARMPAVLIECGYVSHAATARSMSRPEFRQQVAQGIAAGLRKYWEEHTPRALNAALPK
jgi:N-acetylmuramoyl-L-alanine amidase